MLVFNSKIYEFDREDHRELLIVFALMAFIALPFLFAFKFLFFSALALLVMLVFGYLFGLKRADELVITQTAEGFSLEINNGGSKNVQLGVFTPTHWGWSYNYYDACMPDSVAKVPSSDYWMTSMSWRGPRRKREGQNNIDLVVRFSNKDNVVILFECLPMWASTPTDWPFYFHKETKEPAMYRVKGLREFAKRLKK